MVWLWMGGGELGGVRGREPVSECIVCKKKSLKNNHPFCVRRGSISPKSDMFLLEKIVLNHK